MKHIQRSRIKIFFVVLLLLLGFPMYTLAASCLLPDNGSGTATLPPSTCGYETVDGYFMIIDGLPPGTTIQMSGLMADIIVTEPEVAGGSLGGSVQEFAATISLDAEGTGELVGFERQLSVPVEVVVHTGPRTPGDPVQTFSQAVVGLQGGLFGDPDFDSLSIKAGSDLGLPCPGQATLTQLPDGQFAVDSFFDITYQIDFTGAPGGALDGLSGTTTGTVRIQTGRVPVPEIIGLTEVSAETNLNSVGLLKGTVSQSYSNTVPAGNVISSTPAGGTIVTAGSSVALDVSLGPGIDFGDAPDPTYPTLLASNGARHTIVSGFQLGTLNDSESDGQTTHAADGDDTVDASDDEDGVSFNTDLTRGRTATIVVVASAAGYLDAWIDFNGNGSWADASEQICSATPLVGGDNALYVPVPVSSLTGNTFARFRFSTVGGLSVTGSASDGEVEDYRVEIHSPQNPLSWIYLLLFD